MSEYTLAQLAAIYTVYKDLDFSRVAYCCTCGKAIHIDKIEDCYSLFGHYIARSVEPKLKLHPYNIHAQCPSCNMRTNKSKEYDDYMIYRYGKDIKQKLLADDRFLDVEFAKRFYIKQILKLANKFPELAELVVDVETGELKSDVEDYINPIERQWDDYSITYKQDLDAISKFLKTKRSIEYERL